MSQPRTYQHLSPEERAVIMIERQRQTSLRGIARLLQRSPATISREIRRTGGLRYDATLAARSSQKRRKRSVRKRRMVEGTALYRLVLSWLTHLYWSPQQISRKLRSMPDDICPGVVSHETIYAAIYAQPRGALKQGLIQALRQGKASRGVKRTTAAGKVCKFVPEALRIKHRPEEIEHRLLPGHWEGDFIKGAFNRSAVGVLVERKTRFVTLCKMEGCTALDALEGFTRKMKKLPGFMRQSMTYDRGSEMARHAELAERLKMDIWFCDPHAPWQRGSNENTNGLLRQFLPKGVDLSQVTQGRLDQIARLLNGRPRETLNWKSPEEVWSEEFALFNSTVALAS